MDFSFPRSLTTTTSTSTSSTCCCSYCCHDDDEVVMLVVEKWVPSRRNPSKWIIINSSLVLYTLLTACSIVVALRENGEKPVAATFYLFWNFITTFIWCMEAGLESCWCRRSRNADGGSTGAKNSSTSTNFTTTTTTTIYSERIPTSSSHLLHGEMMVLPKGRQEESQHNDPVSCCSSSCCDYYYKFGGWWWKERKREIIEFMIALYFFIGSFLLLWKLKIQQQDAQEELLDVVISLMAYLYACIRDVVRILLR